MSSAGNPPELCRRLIPVTSLIGFEDFGIAINPSKTRASFDAIARGHQLRSTLRTPDGRQLVPWCGLLLDCASLEIRADYTRYAGQPLAASLSISAPAVCAPSRPSLFVTSLRSSV